MPQTTNYMKKIIFMLMAFVIFSGASIAQKNTAKKGMQPTEKAGAVPAGKKAGKMKKDGTPDMRHKESKEAAKNSNKPAGPLKKDGTPDMRHKANKEAAKKK